MSTLNRLAAEIHDTAVSKGWWATDRNFGEQIALMHSELSEALEEWRRGEPIGSFRTEGGKPEGVPVELADCLIRILDTLASYGVDIDDVVAFKMKYNETRTYRHGGKIA